MTKLVVLLLTCRVKGHRGWCLLGFRVHWKLEEEEGSAAKMWQWQLLTAVLPSVWEPKRYICIKFKVDPLPILWRLVGYYIYYCAFSSSMATKLYRKKIEVGPLPINNKELVHEGLMSALMHEGLIGTGV